MGKLFLLGGYDLEMLEIKKLLLAYQKQNNNAIEIADLKLSWGAKLSNYTSYLNGGGENCILDFVIILKILRYKIKNIFSE